MTQTDRLTLAEQAREEALEEAIEARREALASIVRPAVGHKMNSEQRLTVHQAFTENILAAAAEYDELAARFNLPKGDGDPTKKVIPARFVYRARQAFRELSREQERQQSPSDDGSSPPAARPLGML